MNLDVVPGIAPDLRPLVPLDGGRFADERSERSVPRRHQPQHRFAEADPAPGAGGHPRNEKRMLQEAWTRCSTTAAAPRRFRGAAKRLEVAVRHAQGKQGRFRSEPARQARGLFGTVGDRGGPGAAAAPVRGSPRRWRSSCSSPSSSTSWWRGIAETASGGEDRRKESPEVRDSGEIIQDHPVLLNRAPTLHRLHPQALSRCSWKARRSGFIRSSARVQRGLRRDQMPCTCRSRSNQTRRGVLMISSHPPTTCSSPRTVARGEPRRTWCWACYFLTKEQPTSRQADVKRRRPTWAHSPSSTWGSRPKRLAYHRPVHFWEETRWVYTTAGRVIFHSILPDGIRREGFLNQVMRKRDLSELVFQQLPAGGAPEHGAVPRQSEGVSASATPPWVACRSGSRTWRSRPRRRACCMMPRDGRAVPAGVRHRPRSRSASATTR